MNGAARSGIGGRRYEVGSEATAWRMGRTVAGGAVSVAGSGAGRAGLASSTMEGGAPGWRRSVSSAAGKSSALQWAQWRERRK